ncbi:MAG TPA: aminotransferase class I/II-fold pyridoxal phosphate-dependent enzyme [Myxococcota bacterium]|nr:aminotransferase class I/II-fold pyridoxal phosphate-dependent enzyme [Myxococcota bacterium]HPB50460.1 aminotransferase class I/II-fold pyridoxal phosphate-dependent enzyme [Myxococcota bacterium]HQP95414.1 aminotransferase class I/II-fold pyridoxal phosphate-dependent enzyme [Myxococcota bacterium]
MEIRASKRIQSIPAYPFAEIDRMVGELRAGGHDPIDFGVGDPTEPTPAVVRNTVKVAVDERASSGYPSYIGDSAFREAVARWMSARFGVELDPSKEICATIGSKEAVFNFPNAVLDPGDVVLCPSPGYPPYNRGTLFAGGVPWYYPLTAARGFMPDLDAIPVEVASRARIIWVNYPNSPSGVVPCDDFWPRLIDFANKYGLIIGSDEAYSEVWFNRRPRSILEFGRDGIIVFQSLSKRSNMTCHRVGWVCGDERVVALFKKLKTNIDSGTATFIQDGAVAALGDESHVERMRQLYRDKMDVLIPALRAVGCVIPDPDATLYLWPRVPEGMDGLTFAKRLLSPETAVVCTPGPALGEPLADGSSPGRDHVRFALVPSVDDCRRAAERILATFGRQA